MGQPTVHVFEKLQIAPPPAFSFEAKDWPNWKRRWDHYHTLSELSGKGEEFQVSHLVYSMGPRADEILASFPSTVDKKTYDPVLKAFDDHFTGKKNVVYERAMFGSRIQAEGETIEQFVTTLHSLAETCEYGTLKDDLIRDRIVLGVRDKNLSEKLMLTENLTLTKAVEIAKAWESVKAQGKEIHGEEITGNVDRLGGKNLQKKNPQNKKNGNNRKEKKRKLCPRCGKKHEGDCPAKHSECNSCGKKGHWARMCRQSSSSSSSTSSSSGSSDEEDKQEVAFRSNVQEGHYNEARWKETICVGSKKLKFRLDPGAQVTAIPLIVFRMKWKGTKLDPPDKKLQGADKKWLKVVGMSRAKLTHKDRCVVDKVYVIRDLRMPLLGVQACEALGLVKRVNEEEPDLNLRSRRATKLDVRTEGKRKNSGGKRILREWNKLQARVSKLMEESPEKNEELKQVAMEMSGLISRILIWKRKCFAMSGKTPSPQYQRKDSLVTPAGHSSGKKREKKGRREQKMKNDHQWLGSKEGEPKIQGSTVNIEAGGIIMEEDHPNLMQLQETGPENVQESV